MSEESRNDESREGEEKRDREGGRSEDRSSRDREESRGQSEDREGRPQDFRRGGHRDSRDRDSRGSGGQGRPFRRRGPRRKVCRFCAEKLPIDYKDVRTLQSFLNERGKIIPRRTTGNCSWCQRQLTAAIKRARVLALLPFTTAGQF